jgi:hypothetical protein
MIAYFVHDAKKQNDLIVLPEMGCAVTAAPERVQEFIAVSPNFAKWSGNSCSGVSPEEFGQVIATRDESGDVCILDESLWQERLTHYLKPPIPGENP